MGNWYRVVKTIKGHPYLYEQQTFREGGRMRTRNRYLGPADSGKGKARNTRKAAGADAGAVFPPAHRKITDAYPKNFLGINMAWLAGQAKASGYNLLDALIRRVDSQADIYEKVSAIHAVLDEILDADPRSRSPTHEEAGTTTRDRAAPTPRGILGRQPHQGKTGGSTHSPRDVQEEITNTIIAAIESGVDTGTFQMPWHAIAREDLPVNFVTHQPYHGINALMLCFQAMQHGWPNHWASFNQWKERGAQVRKGEHGVPIVFYMPVDIRETEVDADGNEKSIVKTIPVFRYATVFNVAQVANPPQNTPHVSRPVNPIVGVEQFITATKADIRYGGERAYYAPMEDFIRIPRREAFVGTKTSSPTETFYATILHELCHWTSHKDRLNRESGKRFGDEAYAFEELIAEIGAAFACAKLGITPDLRKDHIQYVASWLKILKEDKRAVFTAASAAASAVEYLTGLQPKTS